MNINSIYRPPGIDSFSVPLQPLRTGNKPRPDAPESEAFRVGQPTRPAPKPKFGNDAVNNNHQQWERPFKGLSLAIPRYNGNSVIPYGVNVPPSQGGSGISTEEQPLGEQPTIQPIKQRPGELVGSYHLIGEPPAILPIKERPGELVGSYHLIGEPPAIQPIKPRPEEAVNNQIGTGGAHLGEPPSAGNGIYKVEVPLTAFQAYNNANGLGSTPVNLTPVNLESSRTGNLSINRYITITA